MRNKKIQILLVFVLAIGLFGLLFYWRYGEKKQMESLNGLQETYKEYDKKIREIRNDMENKKAEVNDIEKPANVILAFSEEDQELMDRIVPALEGRGIQHILQIHKSPLYFLPNHKSNLSFFRENSLYFFTSCFSSASSRCFVNCSISSRHFCSYSEYF